VECIASWYIWSRDKAGKEHCKGHELLDLDHIFTQITTGGILHQWTFDPSKHNQVRLFSTLLIYANEFSSADDSDFDVAHLPLVSSMLDSDTGVEAQAAELGLEGPLECDDDEPAYRYH